MRALIRFLTPAEGGRQTLPTSLTYVASTTKIDGEAWDVWIRFASPPVVFGAENDAIIESRGRLPDDFDLYEGSHRVATVHVTHRNFENMIREARDHGDSYAPPIRLACAACDMPLEVEGQPTKLQQLYHLVCSGCGLAYSARVKRRY